ncbi:hypothetical protein AZE42_07445 [Rhizopogon vesiculosus]|uniref:Chromo domain-containing protein n=1 Tax=Rhizopogon vesiculosus TaxID=180088 RepID=A0A1J8QHX6_9AGAM|nr:hypothetical protein AZE42_07445 [Rhizopogon vesiculosus]
MLETSMSDAEYEVESVTKARVDAKRGKKIIWKYYVKWKGYSWDESTWEPDQSFLGGSKHFLKTFWANALTRGRDHTNPSDFEKGEEVYTAEATAHLENNDSSLNSQELPFERSEDAASDDELLTSKKRRIRQKPAGEPKAKRKRQSEPVFTGSASVQRERAFGPKSKATSPKSKKQRRVSSPGPSNVEAKLRLSLTNMTDTDAVGELDTDVFGEAKEVEDELMLMSPDGPITPDIPEPHAGPTKVDGTTVVFQDLKKYSPDFQNTIEVTQVVTEDETHPVDDDRSSPDPLFDSPSEPGNRERSQSSAEPTMPFHRARVAKPLVQLIDTPQLVKNPEVAISAKARLMSRRSSGSSQDASGSNGISKMRPKPGPSRSSARSLGKNRSSLLTAGKGGLTSLKGRFKPTKDVKEEIEPIEDAPSPSHVIERGVAITSWSDEDAAGETDHEHQEIVLLVEQIKAASTHDPSHVSIPSGHELLEIAGLQPDADMLPDFEDANVQQPPQPAITSSVETRADGPTEDAPPSTMTAEDKAAETSLAEATEHLFPSVQTTSSILPIRTSSWKTSKDNTIFGRMYKIPEPVQGPPNGNETVPTLKLNLITNVSVPLVLKDLKNMKGVSLTDISTDKSLGGQVGSFYLSEDAVRIVSTFSGLGSARVVPDPSADESQKGHFDFVAKAGKELLAFFSSQNVEITERLAPPPVLIGLANTVLLMRVQITDRNGLCHSTAACNMQPRRAQKRSATSSADASTSQISSHAPKKTRFVEPDEDPVNFAEEVDSALENPLAKRKGRVKNEGYESDSSDDGEGVVLSRRKDADGEAAEDDDDMFAMAEKEEKKDEVAGKKKEEFLRLGDIEGQEFNEDGEDEESDLEDEPEDQDELERRKKAGMGYELSSFNMREEMEEGKFAADGTYVRSFDAHAVHDRWMDNLDEKEIKLARRRKRQQERIQREKMKAEERELEQSGGKVAWEMQLVGMLKKGETVLDALQRLGTKSKQNSRSTKKVNGKAKDDAAMVVDKAEEKPKGLSDIDMITHLASNLMSLGDTDIYSRSYEELVRSVRSSGDVEPNWVPPSADIMYEFKWDIPGQSSGDVFGPFNEEQMKMWLTPTYFGEAGEKVKVRKVGGDWGDWDDIFA